MPKLLTKIYLAVGLLGLALLACNAAFPQITAVPAPTISGQSAPAGNLPRTDAEVPRVTLTDAKTALDQNSAVFVDVRTTEQFQTSHIAGAISIPLDVIQSSLTSLPLKKEQWIITYCS